MMSDASPSSPDLFGDEEKYVVPEAKKCNYASISKRLFINPKQNMVIGKFPPTVCMTISPLDEEDEYESLQRKAELLVNPPTQQDTAMMRWKFKDQDSGHSAPDDGCSSLETNTHLVEWEDGSFTLFIGNTPFDIDIAKDKSYILEDSQDLKPFHSAIDLRLQARQSNFCQGRKFNIRKFESIRKQRVNLTSHDHAARDNLNLEKRINKNFHKSDMNIQFLESDF